MPTIDFETSVAEFLALGRRLQATLPLTGERVLDELTAWYRDKRIEGAAIDEDADMLLLQWGATRPLIVVEPTDLRRLADKDLRFAEQELQYLDVTRQVFAAGEDEDAEFDDSAVQMSISLGFGPADGSEPMSNLWIHTPQEIASVVKKYANTPFVLSLLNRPAATVTIVVGLCG